MHPRPAKARVAGFTLIEVMVAMAIIAVALPSLLFVLYQQLDGTEHLRNRTLAAMVASNKLAELRLVVAQEEGLPRGVQRGESRLADREWSWEITQENTQLPGFTRVEILVYAGPETEAGPLHTHSAFFMMQAGQGG